MVGTLRTPWWKWLLYSLGFSLAEVLLITVLVTGAFIWLVYQGVDPTEYIFLARPSSITSGAVAAAFVVILACQTLVPVLLIPLFRPAREAVTAYWKLPRPGALGRAALGAVPLILLQVIWSSVAPPPAEQWRMVDHLIYAVVQGGRFWPILWILSVVVVVAPVTEELLFRGIAFPLLRRRLRFLPAAALTALVFGLGHGLTNALPTAVMGFWFAWQVERDDSLAGAMALHALNNLGAVLAMIYGGA